MSHFDNQLLPEESILWSGQPQKAYFHREEARIANLIICFCLVWSTVYGVWVVWQDGLLALRSFSDMVLTILGFATAVFVKLLSARSRSSAQRYWYAVTDKRVLAEIPDDGSRTILSVDLNDVSKITLIRNSKREDSCVGSVTIIANAYRKKIVYFQYINDADVVCSMLEQITIQGNK